MKRKLFLFIFALFAGNALRGQEPVVTAEKLIEYKVASGHIHNPVVPKVVLVCYQRSTMNYLLKKHPDFKPSNAVSHFYTADDGDVGILGDWGVGAPGLAIKMEELVALGAKSFVAVGTAGSLMNKHQVADFIFCPQALAEDGVSHLYLPENQTSVGADEQFISDWNTFSKQQHLPEFETANAWSFSAIFRETIDRVLRVSKLGYSVVEMEAATLYAIGKEKDVQTLSLFVISDIIDQKEWRPHQKEPAVKENLHQLADWALQFCEVHSAKRLD